MKKNIYLLIVITMFLLMGCKRQTQMVDFIPTPVPAEEESDSGTAEEEAVGEETSEETTEATPTPKEIHVGETTSLYVKLDEYGAFLNVRETPSRDGKIIGSLVHTEKVEVIEIADGWASILFDSEVRYVNADFLVKERPDYLTPPSPTPTPKPEVTQAAENTPTPSPKPTSKPSTDDSEEAPPEI